MRLCVAVALISTLVSTSVLAAQGPGKKKKKDAAGAETKSGASMDTGTDPAYSEKSDPGPYDPETTAEEAREKEKARLRVGKKKEVFKPRARDKLVLFGEVFYGFGIAPKPGPANDPDLGLSNDAKVLTLMLGGSYDVSPKLTLGLRAPWSTASVELDSRVDSRSTAAFASPELFLEYRLNLSLRTTLPLLFGVGIPIGQGDPDPNSADDLKQRQGEVQRLADAAQGFRDSELYTPKRIPIVLGVGVRHDLGAVELHASTKVVLGVNTGGDLVPFPYNGGGRLVVNSLAIRDVTLAGLTYQFLRKPGLWVGLDTWLVYTPIEPIEYESAAVDQTDFQFEAEPRLGAMFGKLRPSLGIVFPIGGRLASSGITGLRLHVDYAF